MFTRALSYSDRIVQSLSRGHPVSTLTDAEFDTCQNVRLADALTDLYLRAQARKEPRAFSGARHFDTCQNSMCLPSRAGYTLLRHAAEE